MGFNKSYIGLRYDMLKHIPQSSKNLRILDIGCATGVNGKFLLKKRIAEDVYGIEINPLMAEIAAEEYTEVSTGNLSDMTFLENALNGLEEIDVILIGDVLEHLINPNEVLQQLKTCLAMNGKIILSVPNVQHIDVFINVFIKGYWPLNDRGLFDKTHLRWFTLKNILMMLEEVDLQLVKVERKFRYRDRIGSEFPVGGSILKFFFKNLFTFQYIVVCSRHG